MHQVRILQIVFASLLALIINVTIAKDLPALDIREVHINLSSKTIWLDPLIIEGNTQILIERGKKSVLRIEKRERFVEVTRWAKKHNGNNKERTYSGRSEEHTSELQSH